MLKQIISFYKSVRVKKKDVIKVKKDQEAPITFVKVFHKEYPRLVSVSLPDANNDGELERVLRERKSIRTFSQDPLTLDELSLLLNGCQIYERDGFFERRAYPSAGARFPVEIYPIVFNVNGLERGAYHYNFDKHSLELLLKKDFTDLKDDFVSPFIENPALSFIMTSVIPRSEVKYGNKAYPFSLLEAGHIGQNISLLSAKYKIGCCSVGGYVDETVCWVLDLTSDEIPIYSLAIGKTNGNK
jgi:SagB-type dehydrogenase family enzyme